MKYYNQNPQTTYLLEKAEEQEKVIKELRDEVNSLRKDLEYKDCLYREQVRKRMFAENEYKVLLNKMRCEFENFNSSPWHKKMFYELKI